MPWIIPIAPAPEIPRPETQDVAVDLPQFDAPFRFDSKGKVVVVQQDSDEEIGAAVYNILSCEQGGKLGDPGFGIEAPLFDSTPLDPTGILDDVRRLEPRAEYSAQDIAALMDPSQRTILLQVDPSETSTGQQ